MSDQRGPRVSRRAGSWSEAIKQAHVLLDEAEDRDWTSSVRGDLERRQAPTRTAAFKAVLDLALECLAREAEHGWMHSEVVSIRVEADPDQP